MLKQFANKKWFNPADNTVLDCPGVTYRYNRESYSREKKIFWIIAAVGLVASTVVIIITRSSVIQCIFGAFLGGNLSLIVWLFTIRQQDIINNELALIELHIMHVDEHLEFLHNKIAFIDPKKYEMVEANSESLVYRFMFVFQLSVFISDDEMIDSEQLLLKFSDDKECSIKEYIKKCDKLCSCHFANLLIVQEKWDKLIDWNLYTIDRHLRELKKKLLRYKMYIRCGRAPEQQRRIEDYNY